MRGVRAERDAPPGGSQPAGIAGRVLPDASLRLTVVAMDAPPFEGLSHFQLRVSDLDASVAWYERALGLTKLRGEPGRYLALQSTTGRFRVVLSTGGRAGASGALDHI